MPLQTAALSSWHLSGRVLALGRLGRGLLGSALVVVLSGCGGSIQSLVAPPAATPANAPAAVKTGPQVGYVWSSQARTLRPVLGIPGSTQLGQSVVADNLYIAAAASNLSSLALLQEGDGTVDLMPLPGGPATRLAATIGPGASLRFAPSGLAAIAFLPGASTVALMTNLIATPRVTSIALTQPLTDAAVSDAGSIAAAISSAGAVTIRTISLSGATNLATTVGSLGGMTFVGTGESLLVADASANSLVLVQASTSSPTSTLLPSGGLLHGPLGVGSTRDGRWAVLANAAEPSVVRIDLSGQTAPQRLTCDCKPEVVSPLSGTGVFRITGADTGPAWIVDAAASTPRVLFIPAAASAQAIKAGGN